MADGFHGDSPRHNQKNDGIDQGHQNGGSPIAIGPLSGGAGFDETIGPPGQKQRKNIAQVMPGIGQECQ